MPDDPTSAPGQPTDVTSGDVRTGDINAQIVTVGHESKVIIEKFYANDAAGLRDRRDLLLLAEKVRVFWVEGVLEKSLHGAAMLALGMAVQAEAVSGPWGMVVRKGEGDGERVPPGQPMIETFFKLGRALLILGAPGSGKTTTLLELARDLCLLAERDPVNPVPVVFNLSSWGEHRGRLLDWLVREFKDQYGVPKKMAQGWLEAGALTLLLDGLDEVPAAQRDACVAAINAYRGEHGLAGMAVCSRSEDYGALASKLKLDSAVVIELLTDAQVGGYLAVGGEHTAGLREALAQDESLREMARSPLMLSVMSLAYQDAGADELAAIKGGSETGYRQIFAAYVRRMFSRRARTQVGDYSDEQTVGWLRWLAKQMVEHGESLFLIERLQPNWLQTGWQRRVYGLLDGLFVGLVGGLFFGLLFGLLFDVLLVSFFLGLVGGLIFGVSESLQRGRSGTAVRRSQQLWRAKITIGLWDGLTFWLGLMLLFLLDNWLLGDKFFYGDTEIVGALIAGLIGGLLFGFFGALGSGLHQKESARASGGLNWSWYAGMKGGLIFGLIFGLSGGLSDGLILGLIGGLIFGLIGGLVFGLLGGSWRGQQIDMVERLHWSWRSAIKYWLISELVFGLIGGLIGGLSVGLSGELIVGLIVGLSVGLSVGLIVGSIFFLIGGLRGGQTDRSTKPNQGVWRSLWNATMIGGVVGLIVGLLTGLIFELILELSGGLIIGLPFALLFWMIYGGDAALRHVGLRVLLWRAGYVPWQYGQFLDHAAGSILLRKVGGGYIFVHRYLLEYFAGLDE